MSAKATKVSADQAERRKAFEKLKRSIRHTAPPVVAHDTPQPAAPETPPPPAAPPAPKQTAAPANHGLAFAAREPMMCEVCQQPKTKWLSYKPVAKTCICWDCGLEWQERIMRGEKV